MNQVLLDLEPQRPETTAPAQAAAGAASCARTDEQVGFQIGWDHARHGLVPPPEWLEGTPLGQGWRAGKAVQGGRTMPAPWVTRQWLALRAQAWREGAAFDTEHLTAVRLARLHGARCPITRAALGGARGTPDAPVVERLDPARGYALDNVAVISLAASRARAGLSTLDALRRAHRLQAGEPADGGLDAAAWTRLAALRAFATPLPFHEAARLPLTVLPPPGVVLVNPVQRLQVLLTLQFGKPGWSNRTREIAQALPAHTARQDYHLFIGALAPRVVEAGSTPGAAGHQAALEDAWLHERVLRRWQHFVLSLGEAGVQALIEHIGSMGTRTVLRITGTAAVAPRTPRGDSRVLNGPGRAPACRSAAPRPVACP